MAKGGDEAGARSSSNQTPLVADAHEATIHKWLEERTCMLEGVHSTEYSRLSWDDAYQSHLARTLVHGLLH